MTARVRDIKPKYGRWHVIDEAPRKGKAKQRAFNCLCECGTAKVVLLNDLRRGKSVSCGCVRIDSITTHGECKTRLYNCWHGMISRSNERDGCNVCPEWRNSFENFRDWSLNNGYTDELVLCRLGDVGDYEPSNCRWDTCQSNMEEAHSKTFTMVSPDGVPTTFFNMNAFSREHGLNSSLLHRVYRGDRKSHKGWTRYKGSK